MEWVALAALAVLMVGARYLLGRQRDRRLVEEGANPRGVARYRVVATVVGAVVMVGVAVGVVLLG